MGKRRLKKILINGCSHSEKMHPSQEYHEREITKKYNKYINIEDLMRRPSINTPPLNMEN